MKKKFGVRQSVDNPKLVEEFLCELITNPPKAVDDLEKKKRNFAARKGGTTILNRDLIAVMNEWKKQPHPNPLLEGEGVKREIPRDLENLLTKRAVRTNH